MKKLFFPLIALFFCFMAVKISAQTLVNVAWQDTTGHPNVSFPYQAAAKDAAGNIFIAGNTYVNGQGTSLLLAKYSSSGALLWEETFNDSINHATVAVGLYCKGNDVYVAGTIYDSAASQSSFLTTKYNGSTGTQKWFRSLTGAYGGYDVASCILADASGSVYVAGTAQKGPSEYAMLVAKYDSSGDPYIWTNTYDSTGLYTGAVAMQFGTGVLSTDLVVTGYSGTAFSHWNFVSAVFNLSTGSRSSVTLSTNGNGNFSTPVGIDKDNFNSTYIAGTATISGLNTDIKVIKYDSNFTQKWVKLWGNADSLTTAASSMAMDAKYNILVTGYTTQSNGATQMVVLKYDTGGNLKWSRTVSAPNPSDSALGTDVTTDSSLNVYIVGKVYNGSNYDFITIAYDSGGNPLWEKTYDGGGNDMALNVTTDNTGNVYVSGTSINSGVTTYTTIQYSQLKINLPLVYDTSAAPLYISKELLVDFTPSIVNSVVVNDKDWSYGTLSNIIPDSIITAMAGKLGLDTGLIEYGNLQNAQVIRIFDGMTTADSLSIDRLGDTIHMQPFWSEFIVILPDSMNLQNASDSLSSIYPYIQFAEPNYIGHRCSFNDTYIADQASVAYSSTYPNANIYADNAWSNGIVGEPYVSVGLIDALIDYDHPDFGGGTYATSKIVGGEDFNSPTVPISQEPQANFDQHSTACAGIIGAISNNGTGIAGIAGGNGTAGTGVNMYCLINFNASSGATFVSQSLSAIVKGSSATTTGYGFGLDIECNPWTVTNYSSSLHSALVSCYNNRCAFVESRGNYYTNGYSSENAVENITSVTQTLYPVCDDDELVMNVGASGNDGRHKLGTTGPNLNGDDIYESMYGSGVDFIAPGSLDIVLSTNVPASPGYTDPTQGITAFTDANYTWFSGTSSAAPHVAGAAALLMSLHNTQNTSFQYPNNLDCDDVQVLLKENANAMGQDANVVGSGLINVATTAAAVQLPHYWVQHLNSSQPSTNFTYQSTSEVLVADNAAPLATGYYYADLYKLNATVTANPISSTAQVIGDWPRNVFLSGVSGSNTITGEGWANITGASIASNTLTVNSETYAWHITGDPYDGNTYNVWIPNLLDIQSVRMDCSVHLYDPDATGIKNVSSEEDFFSVYPNPASDVVWASFITKTVGTPIIQITNTTGTIVKTIEQGKLAPGNHLFNFGASTLSSGVYFVSLIDQGRIATQKLIISH